MKFYEWDTQADFDIWHDALCVTLGYPLISINQATGLADPNAAMTIAYTTSQEVDGKIIADVEDQYADGLTSTELRPPVRNFDELS
jgi:hypothetical protein